MQNLDMTLRDLMRAQDVTRWQIVRCGKAQSIAEHSWAVGIIAQKLWAVRYDFPNSSQSKGMTAILADLAHAAMWHDVPEVFTGDINTPTKTYLRAHADVSVPLALLEETAGVMYNSAMKVPEDMAVCLKLADMLEACYFLSEYGEGNYAIGQFEDLMRRTYLKAEGTEWVDAVNKVMAELLDGVETTSFQRVEALLGKNT